MKFQFCIACILSIVLSSFSINAQNPFDCIDATVVCNNATLEIDYTDIIGNITEDIDDFCTVSSIPASFLDDNTVWLKYQFITDGDFYFTINAETTGTDIDFVLFTSPSKTCEDLTAVRCMFTGGNFPGPTDSICIGPTGLSPNSIDTFEEPGCLLGSDNFVTSIDIAKGDVLFLAITNFSLDTSQYSITHGGSAEISCMPVGLEEITSDMINISPNPASDLLQINTSNVQNKVFLFELYNSIGEKVISRKISSEDLIDISRIKNGIYYARIEKDGVLLMVEKVIKM